MSTIKPEQPARDAARDAILLKKLKEYMNSEDLYKKVGTCRLVYLWCMRNVVYEHSKLKRLY